MGMLLRVAGDLAEKTTTHLLVQPWMKADP